ncbi:MAG: right-handed parallel beta-helix repeat-containing protein [Lentisphaeria bacterium]|nr:right-handed parallel beta-helix repeat-containing protein [Lentisphaeria bacterium]
MCFSDKQFRFPRFPVVSLGLFVSLLMTVRAAELHVGAGQTYTAIQDAVNAAANGDTIIIHEGTYSEHLTINKQQLTLIGAYGEARPHIQGFRTDADHGESVVNVPSANVTLRDLEISNANGNGEFGYLVTSQGANLTVDNCVIRNGRYGVIGTGDNMTVQHCEISDFLRDGVSFRGSGGCTVTENWIHGSTSYENKADQGSTYGVRLDAPAGSAGSTADVSYNYISGTRTGIVYRADTSGYPTGTVLLSHNTIDGAVTYVPVDETSGYYVTPWGDVSYTRSGIDLFAVKAATFNAGNFAIRDNLITNCWWYGMYFGTTAEGGSLTADLPVENALFYNNFSRDLWWANPVNRYPEEFPSGIPDGAPAGARPEAGWVDIGGDLVFVDAVIADPQFTQNSLTGPEDYYALLPTSPGWNAASDGTHIGAWQSTVIPEPGMLLLFLLSGTILFKRPGRSSGDTSRRA